MRSSTAWLTNSYRSCADRMVAEVASGPLRHDLDGDQVDQERSGGLLQYELDGEWIDRSHGIDQPEAASERGAGFRIENAAVRVHHVVRRQLVAVMKADAPAEREPVRLVIGRLPGLGELGSESHVAVEIEQAVEDQVMCPRRDGIGRVARVEVVHRRVQRDGDDAGFGRGLGTADRRQPQRQSRGQRQPGVSAGHSSSFLSSASSDSACSGVRLFVSVSRRRRASFSAPESTDGS